MLALQSVGSSMSEVSFHNIHVFLRELISISSVSVPSWLPGYVGKILFMIYHKWWKGGGGEALTWCSLIDAYLMLLLVLLLIFTPRPTAIVLDKAIYILVISRVWNLVGGGNPGTCIQTRSMVIWSGEESIERHFDVARYVSQRGPYLPTGIIMTVCLFITMMNRSMSPNFRLQSK